MNGIIVQHPAPLQNILDVVRESNGQGAISIVAGNNHAQNEANFTHTCHSEAVHEGYLQPLNYSGIASTDEVIPDLQGEIEKCLIVPTCKHKSRMTPA